MFVLSNTTAATATMHADMKSGKKKLFHLIYIYHIILLIYIIAHEKMDKTKQQKCYLSLMITAMSESKVPKSSDALSFQTN